MRIIIFIIRIIIIRIITIITIITYSYSLTEFTNGNDIYLPTRNLLGHFITEAFEIRKTTMTPMANQ